MKSLYSKETIESRRIGMQVPKLIEGYKVAYNTIRRYHEDKTPTWSSFLLDLASGEHILEVDCKKLKVTDLQKEAKSIIKEILQKDKDEMNVKLKTSYLRSFCEEIYGEEDTSDEAEQEEGYLETAIWNSRDDIAARAFDILFEEAQIAYYKDYLDFHAMTVSVQLQFKVVISDVLDEYDN